MLVKKGPIWTRPKGNDPLHPQIDAQLCKPFLQSVYLDTSLKSPAFRYPIREGQPDAMTTGLHTRMLQRFFRGIDSDREYTKSVSGHPQRLRSSKHDGSRADDALAESIRTGVAPPGPRKVPCFYLLDVLFVVERVMTQVGCSPYATAVWNYWRSNGHRPILTQLPVIMTESLVGTAGDYFTIHTCPLTKRETLWLWELKTGWPKYNKNNDIMAPPLAHVWLSPENRFVALYNFF